MLEFNGYKVNKSNVIDVIFEGGEIKDDITALALKNINCDDIEIVSLCRVYKFKKYNNILIASELNKESWHVVSHDLKQRIAYWILLGCIKVQYYIEEDFRPEGTI